MSAPGCVVSSSFHCHSNAECTSGPAGHCEPTNYCTFTDTTCASARRYFSYSDALGGQCLPLDFEAENATLLSPMTVRDDPKASGGHYVASDTASQGSATFHFEIGQPGSYTVWCRVLAPSSGVDSFYVTLDGGKQIEYDDADSGGNNVWLPDWQWTQLNDAFSEQVFVLATGAHTLVFSPREAGSALDRMLITSGTFIAPD